MQIRRGLTLILAIAVCLVITLVQPHPWGGQSVQAANPNISTRFVYYPIVGSTAQQLRSQMNQLGPYIESRNRRFDGQTQWYVRWSYRYQTQGNSCKIRSAEVNTDITFTMPQWKPSTQAPAALRNQWQRYMSALQLHENGHRDHGVAASRDILTALQNLPAYATCQQVETIANNTAQQVIKRYNQADIDYDRLTKHGATQGALFPQL